jgi:hypothetical protein
VSGPVTTMPGSHIALWDLAFLIKSKRLSSNKMLNYPRLHVSSPNRSWAACITNMGGQTQRELLDDIIAEDNSWPI